MHCRDSIVCLAGSTGGGIPDVPSGSMEGEPYRDGKFCGRSSRTFDGSRRQTVNAKAAYGSQLICFKSFIIRDAVP